MIGILEMLWSDLRFGFRMLLKNRGFTIVALLTLSIGIGANTAIFSVVDAVLFRQLPFRDPQRVMIVWERVPDLDQAPLSLPDFLDYRDHNESFEQISAVANWNANFTGQGEPERYQGVKLSANAFQLLGVNAAVGRILSPNDDRPDQPRVAVIAYGLWQRRFGGNRSLIGQTVHINGEVYTVVGVLPRNFVFPFFPAEVAVPLMPDADPRRSDRSSVSFLRCFGRLRPGISQQVAEMQLTALASHLREQYPKFNERKLGIELVPIEDYIVGSFRLILLILFGAVGLVLLIACANLASLVLSALLGRYREMAIRVALGASRIRILRQLLIENLILALIAGAIGILLAALAVHSLPRLAPPDLPRMNDVYINGRVLGFTFLVEGLAGLALGFISALYVLGADLNAALKAEGKGSTADGKRNRSRSALVVLEVALALVLLICTGLLLRSFIHLQRINPGFAADHLLVARLSLPPARYKTLNDVLPFERRMRAGLEVLPGVQSVGTTSILPMSGLLGAVYFTVVGRPPITSRDVPFAYYRIVSPDYFKTMRIPIEAGRSFSENDSAQFPGVALINQTMARQIFPDGGALGSHLTIDDANDLRQVEIVGITADVRDKGLNVNPAFELFIPMNQTPPDTVLWLATNQFWVVRCQGDPELLVSQVRHVIRASDSEVPAQIKTMDDYMAGVVAPRRFNLMLLGAFALTGLLLTVIGIYGVMTTFVGQRTREIGIRMALGARRAQMGSLVVLQGLKFVCAGIAIGVIGALAASRVLANLLFGVSGEDLATYCGLVLLVLLVAALACSVPALRAMRIDPMTTLRQQ